MEPRTVFTHSYILLSWLSLFLHFAYTSASDIDWLFHKSTNFTQSPILSLQLAQNEQKIYTMLRSYSSWVLQNEEFDPKDEFYGLILSYLQHLESTTNRIRHAFKLPGLARSRLSDNVAWNPLAKFHMMKRFCRILKHIMYALDPADVNHASISKEIADRMALIGWPDEADLEGAMFSILRIQLTYDLPTTDMSKGIIGDLDTGINLDAIDCLELSEYALKVNYSAFAVEWAEEAWEKVKYSSESQSEINSAITELLQHAIQIHDNGFDKKLRDPGRYIARIIDQPLNRIRQRTALLQKFRHDRSQSAAPARYFGLCAGENYQTEAEKSKLYCWHESSAFDYMKLMPLKAELLALEPLLVIQFYEVVGNRTMQSIQSTASPYFYSSQLINDESTQIYLRPEIRSSVSSDLLAEIDPEVVPLSRCIQRATGLSAEHLETSVSAYAPGGHFYLHWDTLSYSGSGGTPVKVVPELLRVATFLVYLSDVISGGLTAFPLAGIASKPVPGSAVFWYNNLRSGNVLQYSQHAGCPVIIGEKWVVNLWVNESSQMFDPRFNCVPDQDTHHFVPLEVRR